MATIRPFKAIRPPRDKAHLLASRSYVSYSDKTLKEKLENNPYTFLHIINPEYKKKNKKSGIEKYQLVKEKFEYFLKSGNLIQDEKAAFYLYQQQKGKHIFQGIIAASSVQDYLNGSIKIHEHTITEREEMFKNYLDVTGFNADPVLLSYKGNFIIQSLINKISKSRAEYNFTTTNKVQHQLWKIFAEDEIKIISKTFSKIDKIYIADGHHRSASSALLAKKRKANKEANCNYFMSCLIDEKQLHIINFNRLVKNLNGLSSSDFVEKIKTKFEVSKISSTVFNPRKKNEISMYLNGKCYCLIAKEGAFKADCVSKLDPAILSNNILFPILGIKDEKTNKNITFESGTTPLSEIKNRVDNREFAVAFILKPIPIKTLKEVADKGKIMPPKSTYIEPKLRSGLTIYPID